MISKTCFCWVVLIALLIGTIFSIRWIYPLYQESISENYTFVPIRFAPEIVTNGDVYYSRIRKIIDGNLLPCDPAYNPVSRLKDFGWYATYQFSLIMCSLGGQFTKNTEHAYYFNYFIYPIINFFLIYFLMFKITKMEYGSLLFSMITVLFLPIIFFPVSFLNWYNRSWSSLYEILKFLPSIFPADILDSTQLTRTPNMQFTNIQLFSFVYMLFLFLKDKGSSLLLAFGLTALLALSSLTSSSNFLLCFSIFVCTTLFCQPNIDELKKLFVIFMIASIVSIPGVLINLGMAKNFAANAEFNPVGGIANSLIVPLFIKYLLLGVLPVLILVILKISHKRFVLGVLFGTMMPFFFVTLVKGSYYADKLFIRGSRLLIYCLFFSGLLMALSRYFSLIGTSQNFEKKKITIFKKCAVLQNIRQLNKQRVISICRVILVFLTFTVMFTVGLQQYILYKSKYIYYEGTQFRELYTWSMESVGKDNVAVTLDSDLLLNLPIYSPLFMYIPDLLQTTITRAKRHQRLFETARYYGMSPDGFSKFLDGLIHFATMYKKGGDPLKVRRGIMSMVLSGAKSNIDKKALVQAYHDLLDREKSGFTFKADYWIVSRFDQQWINKGSMADKIQNEIEPVFKNDTYAVYEIPKSLKLYNK